MSPTKTRLICVWPYNYIFKMVKQAKYTSRIYAKAFGQAKTEGVL